MTLKIENVSTEWLAFDEGNARKHSEENIAAIAESLKQFGQRKPIVVTADGVIVAGNGTVEAARLLGLTDVDVVRVPEDWDADRVKAFALADNRTAELAEWNPEVLSAQLLELDEAGFDIEAIGFELQEPDDSIELEEELEVPEPPQNPISKLGDIWLLGKHRLLCGDSTDTKTLEKLMDGAKADLILTDPPYGTDRNLSRSPNREWRLENDTVTQAGTMYAAVRYFDYVPEKYVWGQWNTWHFLVENLGVPDNCIVWVKNHFGMGHGYRHKHEFCAYYGNGKFSDQSDVWEFKRDYAGLHPTMKPVDLLSQAIKNSSKPKNLIVDIFLGSGSTLIAAEQTGRVCYGVELDPRYCDVTIKRWETLTGEKAVLENASRQTIEAN